MRGFSGKRILATLVAALAMCVCAQADAIPAPPAIKKPVVKETAPAKVEKREVDVELKNEVSFELKDMIGWGISLVAILGTLLGIIVVILIAQGFFSKSKGEDRTNAGPIPAKKHEIDARKSVDETKEIVEEIKRYRYEIREVFLKINAESFANNSPETRQAIEDVRKNPQTSLLGRAIAKALSFQEQNKKDEAIETWKGIANVTEGIDDELAARAWFSIGYLYSEQGKHEDAIEAYSRSVDLKPNVVALYNNRGNAKGELNQYEAAIKDFDKAISLNPDYAEAYINRGNAKDALDQLDSAMEDYDRAIALEPREVLVYYNRGNTKTKLGQYKAAIADFDEVLVLEPDDAITYYNRGIAKAVLDRRDEARDDLLKARELAPKTGDENLIALVEQELQKLDKK